MKNTMKKPLSLILVAIMFVTIVPMAYAEGNTYKVGDIVQFGSYPQSKVTDENLVANLNALAPEWEDWTSYGYYSGTGKGYGSMRQGDWMRYTDVSYNNNKYRAVKFTQYRPYSTDGTQNSSYQDDNGYNTNIVYWFKFEPIDWRVLDPTTGLVMCETIIDSQSYSNTLYYNEDGIEYGYYDYFNDTSYTNYASDYETSSIRQWLNNDFYNTAFTDSEKNEINITALNNYGYYTSAGTTGYEQLDSKETNDKIFLLSFNEVRNSKFGFKSYVSSIDKARFGIGSDYALCQGLYVYRDSEYDYNNNSCWLLRSSGQTSLSSCGVAYYGSLQVYYAVYESCYGVRPALKLKRISDVDQSEHQHSYNAVVTQATCENIGYTTFTCECGDTYVVDYVVKIHKDDNNDYKCDYGCGYEFEQNFSEEPEEELNFFQKIIQWFKDLFVKLFGWLK